MSEGSKTSLLYPIVRFFAGSKDICCAVLSTGACAVRPEFDHQFLKKAPDLERQFEDDSSCVSKGSPSADQPSKPSIKMATAAPPSWSRMLAAVVARNPSWQ